VGNGSEANRLRQPIAKRCWNRPDAEPDAQSLKNQKGRTS
jgi:hypothetical protein